MMTYLFQQAVIITQIYKTKQILKKKLNNKFLMTTAQPNFYIVQLSSHVELYQLTTKF